MVGGPDLIRQTLYKRVQAFPEERELKQESLLLISKKHTVRL